MAEFFKDKRWHIAGSFTVGLFLIAVQALASLINSGAIHVSTMGYWGSLAAIVILLAQALASHRDDKNASAIGAPAMPESLSLVAAKMSGMMRATATELVKANAVLAEAQSLGITIPPDVLAADKALTSGLAAVLPDAPVQPVTPPTSSGGTSGDGVPATS